MRSALLLVLVFAAAPLFARAQIHVDIAVPLPTVRFTVAPPLVVVSPGVHVVPDCDDEVFFTDGWYWTRADGRWFRSRDWRGHWVVAHPAGVPVAVTKVPPGHYKRWHGPAKAKGKHKKGKHHRGR